MAYIMILILAKYLLNYECLFGKHILHKLRNCSLMFVKLYCFFAVQAVPMLLLRKTLSLSNILNARAQSFPE